MHAIGKGVPKDLGRAAELYGRACDLKHGLACSNLGTYYNSDEPAKTLAVGGANPARAIWLFQQACDSICPVDDDDLCRKSRSGGCRHLAEVYLKGKGVPIDRKRGEALLDKACKAGNQPACRDLVGKSP